VHSLHRQDALLVLERGRAQFGRVLSLQAGLGPSLLGQRLALSVEHASVVETMVLQQETFVQCWEKSPHLELYLVLALAVASGAWFFQTPCLAHRALVKLCPQGSHRVCPEGCPLEAAWRVALLDYLAPVRLCLQEMGPVVCRKACPLVVAWHVALLEHLVPVRLCPREMDRVCLEVCLLEVAWLSAHRVHPLAAGSLLYERQRPSAEERSWDSPS
jgi:hypothetical protein